MALFEEFSTIKGQNLNTPLPERNHSPNMYNNSVSSSIVREKLSKLHANKACGPDGFYVNVLKNVLDFDVPLIILFQHSLTSGLIPQDWKFERMLISLLYSRRVPDLVRTTIVRFPSPVKTSGQNPGENNLRPAYGLYSWDNKLIS